ncbi:MAG: hypothetical protein AAGA32_04490, partial [Pseudomonadota bacterium]
MDTNQTSFFEAGGYDQIIFQFDGNNNDPDDIAAMPIAALIAAAAGIEDQIAFFYNNNIFEPSVDWQVAAMEEAARFSRSLGIETHSYEGQVDDTTDALVTLLDSGEKVLILEGGPMTATYEALTQVSAENHANITIVSHSVWNENQGVLWTDMKTLFPDVTFVSIVDRNGWTTPTTNSPGSGFKSNWWDWLDASDDPILQEANGIMDLANGPDGSVDAPVGKNPNYYDISYDASDAGMLLWALTETDPNVRQDPRDAQAFIQAGAPLETVSVDPIRATANADPILAAANIDKRSEAPPYPVHDIVRGRAVMEAEDGIRVLDDSKSSWAKFGDRWVVTTDFGDDVAIDGYTGDGVLWRDDVGDKINPGNGESYLDQKWIHQTTPMAYTFTIDEEDRGGKYYIGIRMIKPEGQGVDAGDAGNDVYFATAAGEPILNHKPSIADSSSGGELNWSKVYANGRGEETGFDSGGLDPNTWSWAIQEEGQFGSFLSVQIPQDYVGEWTIYIAARSNKVAIDQIQVIHQSEADFSGKRHALNFDPGLGSTMIAGESPAEARLEMGTETVLQTDADGWVSVVFEEA